MGHMIIKRWIRKIAPRHLFDFFGTMIITLLPPVPYQMPGALNMKYDLEEVRPGRIFGIICKCGCK